MLERLIKIYEDISILDACIELLNDNLPKIKKCRELTNSSPNNADIFEDYLRLAKNETTQLYERIAELTNSLTENIDVLNQIPKNLWYTSAISFIVDDYKENEDIQIAIEEYNKIIERLCQSNKGFEDVFETIIKSQKRAVDRAKFLKSLVEKNESCSKLIPEITLLETEVAREDKSAELKIQKETAGSYEELRKRFFRLVIELLSEE